MRRWPTQKHFTSSLTNVETLSDWLAHPDSNHFA